MSQNFKSISELPETFAVFPLEGVLLLPRGQLPLNIFEPRYLQMFEDVLAQGRFLGMVQPQMPTTPEEAAQPSKLMKTGCLGRITSFSETDDGRVVVSLTGVARFDVVQELDVTTPYRKVAANYRPYESDLVADVGALDVNRDALLEIVRRYLDANGMTADWDGIESSSNEALVNSLSIISPYGPQEKQALLEAESLAQRADILIALTEMVLAQMASAEGSNDNNSMQ
jgi:Lon protease-like protein